MRSRAVILPARCCFSMRAGPPPSRRRSSSFCSCSTRWRMCAWRATSTLFQLGEIGRIHEDRFHGLTTILPLASDSADDLLPFRIGC